jgi:glycosyltransferase involved in cell wall biosynthesis
MKLKLLLITNKLNHNIGGREQLCSLNRNILEDIYKDQFYLAEIEKSSPVSFFEKAAAFRGYIDGLNMVTIGHIVEEVRVNNIDQVFIDGSNFGELARTLKSFTPQVKIYTFFHNVEARFFWRSFRGAPSIRALSVFVANYFAEKKSIKHSNQIICLNERDSSLLGKWYGRSANHIAPMSIADKFTGRKSINKAPQRFVLFVGGDFYANIFGIKWYVDNVSAFVGMHTYIVGRGMEKFKEKFEINDKVRVIGEVDSLEQWYLDSYLVIAPIFDGSGMKTKVAEALMFGKKIIGTPEAFSGYESIVSVAGVVCNNAQEFITAIDNAEHLVIANHDSALREVYQANYSYGAAKNRLENILKM